MKKRRFHTLAFAFAIAINVLAGGTKQLTILHSNDTHSAIQPLSPLLDNPLLAGRGGFLRRLAMVEQERGKDKDLLLFDSGDFSQGSAYFSLYKGEVEIALMNRMGYDAATLGNHEFDNGIEELARQLKKAEFPIVCANYDFSGTPLDDIVKPYTVIERKGVRIGIFGLCPDPEGLISKENWKGITYLAPIESAKKAVEALRNKEQCDVVICLSHLGWFPGTVAGDEWLVKHCEGIDLVLGGHTHSNMEELEWVKDAAGKETPLDQNGKSGIFIGRIVLTLHSK